MATNQICSVDNKQIEIYNENENENEEDDDEEEENSEINCRTEIGEANLVQCKQAQIGNRSDYYGPVKVRTLYKITVPKSHNNTALSGHGSPINFARPFDNSIIGSSTSRETFVPVTASEMARAALGNRRHLSEDTTESDPNSISTNDISDQTPLVTGVNKSKAKQIVCLTAAILGILIMIIILIIEIILYYQINPSSGDDNLPMNFTERLVTRG
ncbi:hypothetical protein O3M35_002449 [Rhynocoris fuscipes]|uniref:Uncharacterized protein n=1 Tax=Rhynocoris fuscipes TaxID=488301 RepID=A0AAW1CS59_9HEMI